ncbi:MAG: glycoside hydrolase family 65 protein, partial [Candidatus Cyclonatronum sp.]|uniref:glycosyl hydrolase family 95 catalytic domain-containing protein n=1 Tax=Cyclonatronum sp. TaxID=3024185 RepID=UPI003447BD06|nr:glycoside hydrolase family 65 protein [Cyclonatronum sp.]
MKKTNLTTLLMLVLLLAGSMTLQAQDQLRDWEIRATEIDPSNYYGITVANGMVGLVTSHEPLRVSDTVLNGIYDQYGRGRVSNILRVFNFAGMELNIDDQFITAQQVTNMQQRLDMRRAFAETTFDVGRKASVRYTVRALRNLPFTSMIELEVTARENITMRAASRIEAPAHLRDVRQFYQEVDRPHVNIPIMTSVAQSPTGRHTVAAASTFLFSEEQRPHLVHEDWDHDMHRVHFTKELRAGETYRFTVLSSVIGTEHVADPHNEAERLSLFAMLEGRDRLIMRHEREWERLWESDIIIEGNLQDQIDVRSALYHLYSFAREGTAYSLSPMGLSGLGYNGHVFWDTELWMYPPLLMLQPEIAKSLIRYRFERKEAARMKAFANGYRGVMFPWESNDTGQEATPVWALSGPFQHHITAVVGIAFWNYYRVTQDMDFLREMGYPLLREVAEFWVSRVDEGENGAYHIINVMAADEWAENVDDNAFTNGAAISALRFATQAAELLGQTPDPKWMEIANGLPILQFEDGTTREHATYEGELIKQADVNLLSFPLDIIRDPDQIRKDLEYYIPRVGAGPAMTHSVFATLYARLGDERRAYELFHRAYRPNELPPFGVIAEDAGGTNPYFATGAGGMLQTVLSGFGGLEITDTGIKQLETPLPRAWRSLTITGVGPGRETFRNNR